MRRLKRVVAVAVAVAGGAQVLVFGSDLHGVPRSVVRLALDIRRQVDDPARATRRRRVAAWSAERTRHADAVLVGDSIADRLPADELPDDRRWARQTLPGETLAGLSARLRFALAGTPRVVLIQSGTNDVLRGRSPSEVLASIEQLVRQVRASTPSARVIVSQLPPATPWRASPKAIEEVNRGLVALASTGELEVVEIARTLSGSDGMPRPGVTTDGVHLSRRAYAAVGSLVRAVINDGRQ